MEILVRNLKNGQTVPHSLVVIEGNLVGTSDIAGGQQRTIYHICIGANTDPPEARTCWPVLNGRFKAVVQLNRGRNDLHLCIDQEHFRSLSLNYEPPRTDRLVKLLYVIASDDAYHGRFQGPQPDPGKYSVNQAMSKIVFGAKLVQTFLAESLFRHGLGRRTFLLETDAQTEEPRCHLFRLRSVTTSQASSLSGHDLWCLVRDELADSGELVAEVDKCKFVAFVSFTRYINQQRLWPVTHKEMVALTKGHVALGGGGLALLGTGCLHTWARNVHEVLQHFTDCTKVDRTRLLDDSGYRGTYWACYARTLGAMCHELGHTFGLCHSDAGMMGQGFGDIHRAFVLPELVEYLNSRADSKSRSGQENWWQWYSGRGSSTKPCPLLCNYENGWSSQLACLRFNRSHPHEFQSANWTRAEAVFLFYHKWLATPCKGDSGEGPVLYGGEIRARHRLRIILVAAENEEGDMSVKKHWEFSGGYGRLTFRLSEEDLQEIGASKLKIIAEDSFGNIMTTVLAYEHLCPYRNHR